MKWSTRRSWLLGASFVAGMAVLTTIRAGGPTPVGVEAPRDAFSAARARGTLEELIGTRPVPRPTGSVEHDRVRDQLVTELLQLGVSPERHSEFICGQWGMCARVTNIVARVPATTGQLDAKAVVLTAHYDTVGASPGVSDDGTGVATVLESLRAVLAAGGRRNHDLIVLLTDGEEIGLLGAQAFVEHHRWAVDAAYYVNLEARGTRGPSYLFEMIGDEGVTLEHYARAAPRPATSSAYAEMYKMLPNLTDLTVYADTSVSGAGFGYIQHVQGYHTPRDDFEHLDMGSLQHHGDNALALVLSLLRADTLAPSEVSEPSVFIDVMQAAVLRVSVSAARVLAWLALLAFLVGGFWGARRGGVEWWRLAGAFVGWLLLLGLAAAIGFALDKAVRVATGSPAPWWSATGRVVAMHWLAAVALAVGLGGVIHRACGGFAAWWGWWALNAVAGLVVLYIAPGFAFLWLWPTLAAAVAVFLASREGFGAVHPAAWALPAAVMLVLWLPVTASLVDAVGTTFGATVSVPALVCVATLLAGTAAFGRRGVFAVGAAALVATGLALAAPASSDLGRPSIALVAVSPTTPGPSSGVYMVGPQMNLGGEALPTPPELSDGAEDRRLDVFPSWFVTAGFHPMPLPRREAPTVEVTRRAKHSVEVIIRSTRAVANFRLLNRGGRIARVGLAAGTLRKAYGSSIGVHGVPGAEGVRVEVQTTLGSDLGIYEVTFGLPAEVKLEGKPITAVRDAVARPFQMGDVLVSGSTVDLRTLGEAP